MISGGDEDDAQRDASFQGRASVASVTGHLKKGNIMYVSASGDRQIAKVKILNSKGIANQTSLESSVAYDSPVQDTSDTLMFRTRNR
jgi:hypothetical protein